MSLVREGTHPDGGNIAGIDEAGATVSRRYVDFVAVSEVGAVRRDQVLHEEAGPQERLVHSRPPQFPFDPPVRHERILLRPEERQKDHVLHPASLRRIERRKDRCPDEGHRGRTNEEHRSDAVEGIVGRRVLEVEPHSREGEVIRDGLGTTRGGDGVGPALRQPLSDVPAHSARGAGDENGSHDPDQRVERCYAAGASSGQ